MLVSFLGTLKQSKPGRRAAQPFAPFCAVTGVALVWGFQMDLGQPQNDQQRTGGNAGHENRKGNKTKQKKIKKFLKSFNMLSASFTELCAIMP